MEKREYKGFTFKCKTKEQEQKLCQWIDSLGENLTEIPDVSEENYAEWHCDFDFAGVELLVLPKSIKRIGKCAFAQSEIENLAAPGVLYIDELAFYNTKKCESVSAPECLSLVATDKTSGEQTEFADCFNHCHARVLELPKVQVVGRYCFYDMPRIEYLYLPSCTQIEPHAIYGCETLKYVGLNALEHAKFSAITMNPKLEEIDAKNLKICHPLAFHGNAKECKNPTAKIVKDVCNSSPANERALSLAKESKSPIYWHEYRGFYYSYVDDADEDLSEEELEKREQELHKILDKWKSAGEVLVSCNADKNESAEDVLKLLHSIYLPKSIKKIDAYGFAKCYGLKSIEAPGIKDVGDHAFYCDEELSNIWLPNCEYLDRDAFNGAATNCNLTNNVARLFIPKVQFVGRHAFWQTGFVLIDMPSCVRMEPTAIEENEILQKIVAKKFSDQMAITQNPNLRLIGVDGKDYELGEVHNQK